MPELKVGDTAPDFELEDQNGKKVKLSSFRGKKNVILAFFPLAFSPVCTNELGELKEKEKSFKELNTVILASSVDSVWAEKAFAKELGIKFSIISDFQKTLAPLYGSLNAEKGFAKRSVFVIDKAGRIAYKRQYEPKDMPDLNEAIETIKRLK